MGLMHLIGFSEQQVLAVSFWTSSKVLLWTQAVLLLPSGLRPITASWPHLMCLNIRWGGWVLYLTFKVPHILSLSFVFHLIFHLAILLIPAQSNYCSLNITSEVIVHFKATAYIKLTVMNAKSQMFLTILWRVRASPGSDALFLEPLSP